MPRTPAEAVASVGEMLAARFQLPFWQVTQTATDANREALRWARAITGRSKVLVFQGCYHGTVEETMVRLRGGRTVPREGAIGPAFDAASAAVAVEFNDIEALERAKAALDERVAQPEFYGEDRVAVRDTLARLQQTITDIDAAYVRWTELESLAGR